jgi:hypothetical protein
MVKDGTIVSYIASLQKNYLSEKILTELPQGKGNKEFSYKVTGRYRSPVSLPESVGTFGAKIDGTHAKTKYLF